MQLQIAGTKKKIFKARLSLKDTKDQPSCDGSDMNNGDVNEVGTMEEKISSTETFIERRSYYLEDAKAKCWEESLLPGYR